MGTNFYLYPDKSLYAQVADKLRDAEHEDEIHIGKRSAAGHYCWDCNITLNKQGNSGIHHSCRIPGHMACDCNWHKQCPKCGALPKKESLSDSSAGRELGFNKNKPGRKKGVSSCCSFSWAINKKDFIDYLARGYLIKDEYGELIKEKDFKEVLKECPVQYDHMIGEEFS
jgi:hypothetical protein